jgi:uncharacterized repeat protein (TIGR02543 family)
VLFDADGGESVPETQNILLNGLVQKPISPLKAGVTFAGWFTNNSFVTMWNFTADAVTGAMTLYARWIQEIVIDEIPTQAFTGGLREPETTVRQGLKTLEKNVDYAVSYNNNVNVGKATAVISFIGDYLNVEPMRVEFNIAVIVPTPTPSPQPTPGPTENDVLPLQPTPGPTENDVLPPQPTPGPTENDVLPSQPTPIPTENAQPTPAATPDDGEDEPDPIPGTAVSFDDVSGHWAETEIYDMAGQGIAQGMDDGSFAPNRAITRAEMMKMLATMSGDALEGHEPFLDVSVDDWHAKYVAWGWSKGIANGLDAITFSPNERITRQEMMTMISRYLDYKGLALQDANVDYEFTDKNNIKDWATVAVELARKSGLAKGFDETQGRRFFYPNEHATRAESTVMLLRVLNQAR